MCLDFFVNVIFYDIFIPKYLKFAQVLGIYQLKCVSTSLCRILITKQGHMHNTIFRRIHKMAISYY
jgi:hypothetical protein